MGEAPLIILPDEWALFEARVQRSMGRCSVRIHATTAFARSIHFALQVASVSVSRFVQHFAAHYARAANSRRSTLGTLFTPHHRSVLIEPREWLVPLVRYIHWLPVIQGVSPDVDSYPYGSHQIYLGARRAEWITTAETCALLADGATAGRRAYREAMSQAPSERELQAFTQGSSPDRRVIGDPGFLSGLPPTARRYRKAHTLAELVMQIVRLTYITEAELGSRSKRRDLVLARAMLTFHATVRGDVTLAEVARYLRRDPSTLSGAVDRYRRIYPSLFRAGGLQGIQSLRDALGENGIHGL